MKIDDNLITNGVFYPRIFEKFENFFDLDFDEIKRSKCLNISIGYSGGSIITCSYGTV